MTSSVSNVFAPPVQLRQASGQAVYPSSTVEELFQSIVHPLALHPPVFLTAHVSSNHYPDSEGRAIFHNRCQFRPETRKDAAPGKGKAAAGSCNDRRSDALVLRLCDEDADCQQQISESAPARMKKTLLSVQLERFCLAHARDGIPCFLTEYDFSSLQTKGQFPGKHLAGLITGYVAKCIR